MKESSRTRQRRSCRTICAIAFIPSFIVVIFLVVWRPLLLPYFFRYAKMIISEFMIDKQRFEANQMQLAHKEWRMYQIESRFGQDWCKENVKPRSDVTWLTVTVNEDFAAPTLVLGNSIRTFSCQKNMVAFVSEMVSEGTRKALQSVGWETRVVEEMDCDWLDAKLGGDRNSGWLGKPLGHRIRGTHTRFHAWNYTEYSKIIYLDADFMLMTNMDELFDIPDDFAAVPCSRPGVLEPCFNAGLLVVRPDTSSYQEIMHNWWKTTEKDTCPTDQVLLWHHYADTGNWKALPYAYNIRRIIFRPLNSFHYACCKPAKPWSAACRPSRIEAKDFKGPVVVVDHVSLIFWKNFYELLEKYNLDKWWRSTKFFQPSQEFGVVSYADCLKHVQKYSG